MPITEIRLRRGTSTEWAGVNPVLADGEPALDTTLRQIKIGDGVSDWASLGFSTVDTELLNQLLDDITEQAGIATQAAGDAVDAVTGVAREANGGVMGIGSDGTIATPSRIERALSGINALAHAPTPLSPGGDIGPALVAATAVAKENAAALGIPAKVYVPDVAGGWTLTTGAAGGLAATFASGVEYEGGGYVVLKMAASVAHMLNFTSLSTVKVHGFTFDLYGNVTTSGAYLPSTAVDIELDDNRWINSKTRSVAVTNKVKAGGTVTLDIANPLGADQITTGMTVIVYGVNGTAVNSYADAGAFNTATAVITAHSTTQISYTKTGADVASTPVVGGWVTAGQVGASVYAINCTSAIRPVITRQVMTGIRAGIRSHEATFRPTIERNQFYDWGDRCIFGIATANGCTFGAKINANYFDPPSQKFGDPHQPIAFQGVANLWHNDVECTGNTAIGATDSVVITNKSLTGNVVTLTYTGPQPAGFIVGAPVTVAINDPVFDGPGRTLTAVTGTTFSYAKVNADVASAAATGSGYVLKAHHARNTADLLGGTADMYSFHHTRNLSIHHNVARFSGEVGYTISNDCTMFSIDHNVADYCNSVGYALDWGGTGTSFIGKGSSLDHNKARNCGQERGQAATGQTPRAGANSGYWLSGVTGVLVDDNIAIDDQQTPSQTAAYYIKDATTDLSIGKTKMEGGTTQLLLPASSYTGTIDFFGSGSGGGTVLGTVTTSTPGTVAGAGSASDATMWTATTIAPADLAVGQVWRLDVDGTFDSITNAGGPGAFNLKVKIGAAFALTLPMLTSSATAGVTGQPWSLRLDIYVEATGAGGQLSLVGHLVRVTGNTNTPQPLAAQDVGSARSLASGMTVSIAANTATANVGNVIRVLRASLIKAPTP